jgi:hypothetical protein
MKWTGVDRGSAREISFPCTPKNPYFILLYRPSGQGGQGKQEIIIPMGKKNKIKNFLSLIEMNVRNRVSLSTSNFNHINIDFDMDRVHRIPLSTLDTLIVYIIFILINRNIDYNSFRGTNLSHDLFGFSNASAAPLFFN